MSCPSRPESSKNKTRNIHTLPSVHKGPTSIFILKASLAVWLSCHQSCHDCSSPRSQPPKKPSGLILTEGEKKTHPVLSTTWQAGVPL